MAHTAQPPAPINNAGIIVQGPLELVTAEDLRLQFAVNTLGPAYAIRSFLPLLRAGGGRVINISAPTARVPAAGRRERLIVRLLGLRG